MMRRKAYDTLLDWKRDDDGRTALLIEGARRVGKSYLVSEFAKNEYRSHIILDFSNPDPKIVKIFENDIHDIPLFLEKLSRITRTKLYERESLIVFDEIQFYPKARQAIKFLVADGRYDYIETGSLISIKENVKDILIPSEERSIRMYPMDFEEFCWAMGDEVTVPNIRTHFEERTPLGNDIHDVTMRAFRTYMLVGGMPQAVEAYARRHDFSDAEAVKRTILELYRNDVRKRGGRLVALFDDIPSQLNKHDRKFNLSRIEDGAKMSQYEDAIFWLEDSMIANLCYNSSVPDVALRMNLERTTVKCYMGDTGLLISMAVEDGTVLEDDVYLSLLEDRLHVNEGMFAENMVAQMLRAGGHELFFHSFYEREENNNRYEIDFLIRDGKRICPIEVKTSVVSKHASLDRYMRRYSKTLGQAYVLCRKDLRKDGNILYLPIYMAICL